MSQTTIVPFTHLVRGLRGAVCVEGFWDTKCVIYRMITPQELKAELEYLVMERLGLMYADEPVSKEEEQRVRNEVAKEIGALRDYERRIVDGTRRAG